jgi:hypothetical protein
MDESRRHVQDFRLASTSAAIEWNIMNRDSSTPDSTGEELRDLSEATMMALLTVRQCYDR